MKALRFFFIALLSLINNWLGAQFLTDSSIVFNWQGQWKDEYVYECRETETETEKGVSATTTTTYKTRTKILDVTDSTFLMEVVSYDFTHDDPEDEFGGLFLELMTEFGSIPIRYELDEYGNYKRIVNPAEMKGLYKKAIDKMMLAMEKKVKESGNEVPKDALEPMRQYLYSWMESDEQVEFWQSDTRKFYMPYGYEFMLKGKTWEAYYYTHPYLQVKLPSQLVFTVANVDKKNNFAKINAQASLDKEYMAELLNDFAVESMERLKSEEPTTHDIIINHELFDDMNYLVNYQTGQMLKVDFTRTVKDKDSQKVVKKEYKLVTK